LHLHDELPSSLVSRLHVNYRRLSVSEFWQLVRVQNGYINDFMLFFNVKNSVQKRNQHFFLVLVAEDFAKSNVIFNVCEFHKKKFDLKIQKPLELAAVFAIIRAKGSCCFTYI
jgi:hypothetical protein